MHGGRVGRKEAPLPILAEQIRRRGRAPDAVPANMPTQADVSDATKRSEYSQETLLEERLQSFATSMAGTYEPKFDAGTAGQYLRDDKTWQVIQQSDVSGLIAALASKAALAHIHAINDITGLSAALSGLSDAAAAKVAKAGDTMTGPLVLPTYLKAALPSASTYARSLIYVSDLTGGAEFCYSDGTNWRRVSDRSLAN